MYYNIPSGETKAGIAIGFDDSSHSSSWIDYHTNFGAAKNWKATFNVYETAVAQEITDIGDLVTAGHELGNHGLSGTGHIQSYDPLKTDAQFLTDVIVGVDDWMNTNFGVRSKTFVWPLGLFDQYYIDHVLANGTYKGFRRTGGIYVPDSGSKIGWTVQDDLASGQMIAGSVDNLDDSGYTSTIEPALEYARDNNKIAMLYGHAVNETLGAGLDTKRTVVDSILDFVNNNNMKFYTYNEIADTI